MGALSGMQIGLHTLPGCRPFALPSALYLTRFQFHSIACLLDVGVSQNTATCHERSLQPQQAHLSSKVVAQDRDPTLQPTDPSDPEPWHCNSCHPGLPHYQYRSVYIKDSRAIDFPAVPSSRDPGAWKMEK